MSESPDWLISREMAERVAHTWIPWTQLRMYVAEFCSGRTSLVIDVIGCGRECGLIERNDTLYRLAEHATFESLNAAVQLWRG